jgi:hypothetical protein
MKIVHLCILISLFLACGKDVKKSSTAKVQNVSAIYSSSILSVKVFYEDGAEPYVGGTIVLKYWELLQKNLEALFQGRSSAPSLSIPKELNEMTKISPFFKASWSLQEVLSAANTLSVPSTPGTTTFKIIFVNGISDQGAGVIGYSVNGENLVVIFKDVVKSTSVTGNTLVPTYVEQSTLIHEMGHALGLVNNGLPMINPHQDSAHGAHCSNPNCVMYYANEGLSSMRNFAQNAATNFSVVMFDQQCLDDSRQY